MEHLNCTLKDYLLGLGANVSEAPIVQTSKSLCNLMEVSSHFDIICDIRPESIYHTCQSYGKDLEMLVEELSLESRVFDYIPGCFHRSFLGIKPHIRKTLMPTSSSNGPRNILINYHRNWSLGGSYTCSECRHAVILLLLLPNIE